MNPAEPGSGTIKNKGPASPGPCRWHERTYIMPKYLGNQSDKPGQ